MKGNNPINVGSYYYGPALYFIYGIMVEHRIGFSYLRFPFLEQRILPLLYLAKPSEIPSETLVFTYEQYSTSF